MSENHSETNGEISVAARSIAEAVSEVIVGGTETIHLVLVALFAKGHILLEDVPGTGKTLMARTFAKVIGGEFSRIQFTPDLMPADILGSEDHLGDMDFKVAGTKDGITSLQMDIKITGITFEIMEQALKQAKDGRIHILGEMAKALSSGRDVVSDFAPRITTFSIPKEKIRDVIGTGGKIIREICEETGAKVDIDDDGTIKVSSVDNEAGEAAVNWIQGIVAEPEVGRIYTGKVVKIMDFGAFVNFFGKRDGLVHVSQLANERVDHPKDVLKEGQEVKVKLLGFDDRGKVRLSMKVVDQETGEEIKTEKTEKKD